MWIFDVEDLIVIDIYPTLLDYCKANYLFMLGNYYCPYIAEMLKYYFNFADQPLLSTKNVQKRFASQNAENVQKYM